MLVELGAQYFRKSLDLRMTTNWDLNVARNILFQQAEPTIKER